MRHVILDCPKTISTREPGTDELVINIEKTKTFADTSVSICIQDLLDCCPSLNSLEAGMPDLDRLKFQQQIGEMSRMAADMITRRDSLIATIGARESRL